MIEGFTPTRVATSTLPYQTWHGHVTPNCEFHRDGGVGCPACLALRLPADLPEHRWPWEPHVGPEAVLVPVPEDHR